MTQLAYEFPLKINKEFKDLKNDKQYLLSIRISINSYLGTMIHFSSYKLRLKILSCIDSPFYDYFMTDKNLTKVVLKTYYV